MKKYLIAFYLLMHFTTMYSQKLTLSSVQLEFTDKNKLKLMKEDGSPKISFMATSGIQSNPVYDKCIKQNECYDKATNGGVFACVVECIIEKWSAYRAKPDLGNPTFKDRSINFESVEVPKRLQSGRVQNKYGIVSALFEYRTEKKESRYLKIDLDPKTTVVNSIQLSANFFSNPQNDPGQVAKTRWEQYKECVKAADCYDKPTELGVVFCIGDCIGAVFPEVFDRPVIEPSPSETSPTNEATNKNDIVIRHGNDYSWDHPGILKELGYKSIMIEKGNYTIKKDEKYPFGTVTLNVLKSSPSNGKAKTIILPGGCWFRGLDCYTSGLAPCNNEKGFGKTFEQASIEPVIENGILKNLKIVFLTAGITNGNKYENNKTTAAVPSYPFTIELSQKGYTSNNPEFLKSYPPLQDWLWEMIKKMIGNLNTGLIITIAADGNITSSNESLIKNGTKVADLFKKYGSPQLLQDVVLTVNAKNYNITGIDEKTKAYASTALANTVEAIRRKLSRDESLVVRIDKKGNISSSNPKIIPNTEQISAAYRPPSEEYKQCVGDTWWAPVFAQVLCLGVFL